MMFSILKDREEKGGQKVYAYFAHSGIVGVRSPDLHFVSLMYSRAHQSLLECNITGIAKEKGKRKKATVRWTICDNQGTDCSHFISVCPALYFMTFYWLR